MRLKAYAPHVLAHAPTRKCSAFLRAAPSRWSGDAAVRLNEEKLPGAQGFCFTLGGDVSGSLIAAGGEDGVLRVWGTAARKLIR
jgi:hypothetical protein